MEERKAVDELAPCYLSGPWSGGGRGGNPEGRSCRHLCVITMSKGLLPLSLEDAEAERVQRSQSGCWWKDWTPATF